MGNSQFPRHSISSDASVTPINMRVVDDVMGSLPADHSEILILVCIKDKSYEEVSALLNIPAAAVRERLSKARSNFENSVQNRLMGRSGPIMNYLHP